MYTILPVYQDKMPASFIFDTIDEAVAGAELDFADPHTPDTKGFMVVKIEKAISIDRSLNTDVEVTTFIQDDDVAPELTSV
jgi:hypothetical protein